MDFKLSFEFIELDNLLKAMDLVASGAQARQLILDCGYFCLCFRDRKL